MENSSLYGALAFGIVSLVLASLLYFSNRRLRRTVSDLEGRLQVAESRTALSLETHHVKPEKQPKTSRGPSASSDELIRLRKEAVRFREQINQLRSDLQAAESSREEARKLHMEEVRQLVLERDSVEAQLSAREQNQEKTAQKQTALDQKSNAELEKSLKEMGQHVASLERNLQTDRDALARLKLEKQNLEGQLKKWTTTAKDFDGKPLDPVLFRRWKDRALTARVQYKMMKQLREMSDIKLSTYQDSVVKLADFVFESTGSKAPRVQNGEVKSDRYLAQALDILLERNGRTLSAAGAMAGDHSEDEDEKPSALAHSEASNEA